MAKKRKTKKKKIIYHDPPMKYNVALHKFEVDLPTVKKENQKIDYNPMNRLMIVLIVIVVIYFIIINYV